MPYLETLIIDDFADDDDDGANIEYYLTIKHFEAIKPRRSLKVLFGIKKFFFLTTTLA